MKTTGQVLQEARLSRKMELVEVADITKIRIESLKWLEEDNYLKLPNATIAKGFIKNYGQFLGLNANYLMALFRRDFVENNQGQIVPRGMVEPVTKAAIWTPKKTVLAGVTLLFAIFFGYLGYQYTLLIGPPNLTIISPMEDYRTTEPSVEVAGTTDPEATISVNNQLVALEKGGEFYVKIPLNDGDNVISVTSTRKTGKKTTITRRVTLTVTP